VRLSRRRHVARYGLALVIAALLLLGACQNERGEQDAELFVFGTVVELKINGVPKSQADRAIADLQQMFQQMHRDWHAWEPGLLVDINRAFAEGRAITADSRIVGMIRMSQQLEEKTGGRFNPAIGGLIELWGFHTSDYPIEGPPPGPDEINAWVSHHPSTLDIDIDGLRLSTDNPFVQLDFGGLAKGYAVDLAIEHLRSLGIENAIVNAGGDLRAIGSHGDRPWRVAVRKPGGGVIGTLEVRQDEAMFTSGNYERFRQDEGKRYPHILNPLTGWPVQDVASATVITGNGALADAAATALIVAGLDDWAVVARALGLSQVLMVDEDGAVYMTPDMAARIQFTEDVTQTVVDLADTPGS